MKIKIATRYQGTTVEREVEALGPVKGVWVANKPWTGSQQWERSDGYRVTHVPTGCSIGTAATASEARDAVQKLAAQFPSFGANARFGDARVGKLPNAGQLLAAAVALGLRG